MWFKIIYIIFLILAFLFPIVTVIGPVTIRHIVMVVMFFICVNKGIHWDKYMTLFTIFVVFWGLSSFATGYADDFLNKFIGTYLQAYTMFFSTYILIKKYDGANWLYVFLLVFGLLNALVTIGQFFHLEYAVKIVEIIGTNNDDVFKSRMERYDIMEGVAVQGLVDSVRNGYFISATAVLALYNKKGKLTLLHLSIWLFTMIASILAQERMGLFVAALLSSLVILYYVYLRFKGSVAPVVFVFVMLILLTFGMEELQNSTLRFSKDINIFADRGYLASMGWDFFLNHPFGAYYEYLEKGYRYPHNVFISMFLVGGVVGGTAILLLFLQQLKTIAKYLFKCIQTHKLTITPFFGLMFVAYSLNSLAHNASIVYGTFEFFIFWGAFEALITRETYPMKNVR